MAITESDIKLLKSARMTDTSDGGGQMTGNVVQSGVDNNIFDDVSALDRVYGQVSLRKVFPAVLTNTTDKFLGARVIIDKPPADSYVHGVMFAASSIADRRDDARVKVEAYLAVGSSYQGFLYGNHLAGMMTVMLIQQQDRSLPTIGSVLVLRKDMDMPSEETQYVRITEVSSEVLTFTDANGDFKRRVVTCTISDPLRVSFPGFEASREDANVDFTGRTKVFNTIVANAAQYFGIRPLETAASIGDFTLKADTIFSPIIPSAQIETPIADSRTNNQKAALLPAGQRLRDRVTMNWSPSQNLFLGGGITPNSFVAESGSVTIIDRAGVLYNGSTVVGSINHTEGIAVLSTNVFGGPVTIDYSYMPAESVLLPEQTMAIPVTLNNRSLTYVATLVPMPAAGSLSVTYMSEGGWYTLSDRGDGVLGGSDTSVGVGSMNYQTGTCTVTLGALPDVPSAIIFSWVEPQNTTFFPVGTMQMGGFAYFPINTNGEVSEEKGGKALDPNSVSVSWQVASTTYTATDNGLGLLQGDGTGTVDYSNGVVRLIPNTLPPIGTVINLSGNKATRTTKSGVNINGGVVASGIVPRTVAFDLDVIVYHTATDVQSVDGTPKTKTVKVIDAPVSASVGNLFFTDGPNGNLIVGQINYTTGIISITPATPLTAGLIDVEGVTVTYLGVNGSSTGTNTDTSWNSSPANAGASVGMSTVYTPPQPYPPIQVVDYIDTPFRSVI